MSTLSDTLRGQIAATPWYHTLVLPDGSTTPGEYDLRRTITLIPFPESLEGKRCLDVGTRDGFWAFEMEKRGAQSVIGIDLDDPARYDWPTPAPTLTAEQSERLAASRKSFAIAKEALGSSVERRDLTVYDLSEDLVGRFDFAFIGTLLPHLRDPVGALTAIRRVISDDGVLLVNEAISWFLTMTHPRKPSAALATLDAPFWWLPNSQALRRMVEAAGFEIERIGRPYVVDRGPSGEVAARALGGMGSRLRGRIFRQGMPHVWVLARPR
jgi:2-polyprenyl-3-methyl-5-hydroxy-6-metoxy-1,4-benzoquinol methylase